MIARDMQDEASTEQFTKLFRGVTVNIYKVYFTLCMISENNARTFAGETRYVERMILRQQWDLLVLQLWALYCDNGTDACTLSKLISFTMTAIDNDSKTQLRGELNQIGWKKKKYYDVLRTIDSFRTNGIAHMLCTEIPDASIKFDDANRLFELAVKCYELFIPSPDIYGSQPKERIFKLSEQSSTVMMIRELFDYLSLSSVYAKKVECDIDDSEEDDIGQQLKQTIKRINENKNAQRASYSFISMEY